MTTIRQQALARQEQQIDENVARIEAERARPRTALEAMALRLNVSPNSLQNTLKNTAFKGASDAEFVALVIVANTYELNPMLREIYAFPKKGGGIQAIVGYDGWIKIADRHPQYDGMEFIHIEDEKGELKAVECIIYRRDRSHPIKKMLYLKEFKRNTDPWNNSPRHMLDVRCYCHTVRLAFGVSLGIEGDEDVIEGSYSEVRPQTLPSRQTLEQELDDEIPNFDRQTGEVRESAPRGMTEVDEATARELDAGFQSEGRTDEQHGDQHDGADDEEPVWAPHVKALREQLAAVKTKGAFDKADQAFQRIMAGLPDDVAQSLDEAFAAKRREISGGQG